MAIIINDNIRVNAGKPVDAKYLSTSNTPYTSIAAVNAAIAIPERHVGLTVNIMGVEYWYTGVTTSPIQKKYDTVIPSADFVTGGTNLGFFTGFTGVQSLLLNRAGGTTYDGWYYSTYGWYYRGTDGIIYAGTPSDGIPKRAYINPILDKSWIWNEYTGNAVDQLGWILIDGNIQNFLGVFVNGVTYYPPSTSYGSPLYTSWTTGTNPNNGSNMVVDVIAGSLTTGVTITVGAPIYAGKVGKLLEFRTLQTKTPSTISVSYDEAFVYVSGKTQITQGQSVGTGVPVLKGLTGNTLQFRSIIGSGNTTVIQNGDNIVIFSSGGTGGIITGSSTYNLSSPSVCCVGGMLPNTILTGKTAFQLFEEILVPDICGTLTPQSGWITSTAAATYEIGCSASFTVTGNFSRGSISPQGQSASSFRVGAPTCYIFTGPQAGTFATSALTQANPITSYVIPNTTTTWTVQTCYGAGVQPISSKGVPFNSACGQGITPTASISVLGILPWYWGTSASGSITGADISTACCAKVVANAGASTPITYNTGVTPKYLWFAAPTGTFTPKTKWWVCSANAGTIDQVGDLWRTQGSVSVNSLQSCWSGCAYSVYVTCYATTTAGGIPMCLYY